MPKAVIRNGSSHKNADAAPAPQTLEELQAIIDEVNTQIIDVAAIVANSNDPADGNPSCSSMGAEYSSCSYTNLHIKDATGSLNDGNWKLYFHSIRRVLRIDSEEFSVSHVNGDLNYLEPTAGFTGFTGDVKTVGLVTEFNYLIETDLMPRYWLARDNGEVTLIANTNDDTDELQYATPIAGDNRRAFNGESIPLASAASRFETNQPIQSLSDTSGLTGDQLQARIIPQPQSVVLGAGSLNIANGFSFAGSALSVGNIAALTAPVPLSGWNDQ